MVSLFIKNNYLGYLSEITRADQGHTGETIWKALSADNSEINEYSLGANGLVNVKKTTDDFGFNYTDEAKHNNTSLQNFSYSFTPSTGNLYSRKDINKDLNKTFEYDELDRLVTVKLNGDVINSMQYKSSGNIQNKGDVSEEYYLYKITQPQVNAVNILTKTKQGLINNFEQDIKWNSFNKIEKITEKDYYGTKTNKMSFVYGISDERTKAVAYEIASDNTEQAVCTKYYAGTYEKEVYPDSTRELHYISSDNGLIAIYVKSTAHPEGYMYYILKDHLGSITGIINENGAMLRELSYDAWGRRRDSATWLCFDAHKLQKYKPLIDRGYTCHEQMDKFGMINMNGRLYDPVTGQMLSPDNNVSSTFSQGFNRYTYCNNNPLKYIDPTGQTAIGGNSWNNYQNDFSVPGNPFIGGSYINQQEFLTDNDIGCFHYLHIYAFGETGWIYESERDGLNVGGGGDLGLASYVEIDNLQGNSYEWADNALDYNSSKERINNDIYLQDRFYKAVYGPLVYNFVLTTAVPKNWGLIYPDKFYINLTNLEYYEIADGLTLINEKDGKIEIHISPGRLKSEEAYFQATSVHEFNHALDYSFYGKQINVSFSESRSYELQVKVLLMYDKYNDAIAVYKMAKGLGYWGIKYDSSYIHTIKLKPYWWY